jgi:hypothetical protein
MLPMTRTAVPARKKGDFEMFVCMINERFGGAF